MYGVLFGKGCIVEGEVILILENMDYCEYAARLVKDIFGCESRIFRNPKGGRCVMLSFSSPAARSYIESLSTLGGELVIQKCGNCLSSFLRGVFLASGRVADPNKQYSLEFSVGERTEALYAFLSSLGLAPKISVKKNETVIYFRNSSMLEDFFALANMNQTAFDIMNAKIKGELRNTANRIANCELNNIGRATAASYSQIELIEQLIDRGLISLLPDELEKTAMFRMENRDMSLSQMAGAITPPISKSGLSHRLKKITEMAENILSGKLDDI